MVVVLGVLVVEVAVMLIVLIQMISDSSNNIGKISCDRIVSVCDLN